MSASAASRELRKSLRDSAIDFLSRADHRSRIRELRSSALPFDRKVWQAMAKAGWTAIHVPEADGGLGLGVAEAAAIAEAVGEHLLPEPFVSAGVQTAAALVALPDGGLKSELIGSLVTGDLIAGLAWQEREGQIEPEPCAVRGAVSGEDLVITGEKFFVEPGKGADGWLVLAQEGPLPALYWVPSSAGGVRVADGRRADGAGCASVSFDAVRVPSDHRLARGPEAVAAVEAANDTARIAQGAELVGIARSALAVTLEYLRTRTQFKKPLGSFQALKHRAVDAHLQVALAAACLDDVLNLLERPQASRRALASRVKARCADAALSVARLAVQFHGAMGTTDECDVGLYFKRALSLSSRLGTAAAHRKRYFQLQRERRVEDSGADAVGEFREFPRDCDWEEMPEEQFRRMIRAFLARHYPPHLRYFPRTAFWEEVREWYLTLSRQGWVAPAWPKEFGGMGLPPDKLLAFHEEQERYGVARSLDMGVTMLGPVLMRYGTREQRETYLPKILSGEHVWCQGYSEPEAGSDLAAVRTEARIDGEEFVITGRKIWTSHARSATHMFMLVRTDRSVKKQAGISFVLVDLVSRGISIRDIPELAGHTAFFEVTFDEVRVPMANLVGGLNQGWTVAKALLGFERLLIGSPGPSTYTLEQLTRLAEERGLFGDSAFVARYVQQQLDIADLSALYGHFAEIVKGGESLRDDVSILKIWATETYQRTAQLLSESAAEYGAGVGNQRIGKLEINVLAPLYMSTAATIYGGTSEIQRNIVAKQVLMLPD